MKFKLLNNKLINGLCFVVEKENRLLHQKHVENPNEGANHLCIIILLRL